MFNFNTQKVKYLISGAIIGSFLTSAVAFADLPIKLIVNGKEIQSDVPPQIIDGRVLVPARPLAEALGANVSWDSARNSVIVTTNNYSTNTSDKVNSDSQINKVDNELFLAVSNGDLDKVKSLLKSGSNPNSKDAFGEHILESALNLKQNRIEMFKLLIESGADINTRVRQEPLIFIPNTEIIEYLLSKGANPNMKSDSGATPLMNNAKWGTKETVNLLLSAGANINEQDNIGNTPLIYAVNKNLSRDNNLRIDVVKLLIEKGANPNIQNKQGQTAFSIAASLGDNEVYQILQSYKK